MPSWGASALLHSIRPTLPTPLRLSAAASHFYSQHAPLFSESGIYTLLLQGPASTWRRPDSPQLNVSRKKNNEQATVVKLVLWPATPPVQCTQQAVSMGYCSCPQLALTHQGAPMRPRMCAAALQLRHSHPKTVPGTNQGQTLSCACPETAGARAAAAQPPQNASPPTGNKSRTTQSCVMCTTTSSQPVLPLRAPTQPASRRRNGSADPLTHCPQQRLHSADTSSPQARQRAA